MKKNKVDCLDLRDKIKEQNLNHHQLFLKTDHHWKTETGLWATKEICKYFEYKYRISFDYSLLSKNNYSFRLIENAFLGSAGRKVTLGFTKPDNLTIAYPKFETKLSFSNFEETISGSFKDVLVDDEKLRQIRNYNYYEQDRYNFYKSNSFFIIENNCSINNITCLFLVDSYQEVVTPFLALMVKNIIIISPRGFNGSIKSCIDYYKPDIVCVAQTSRRVEQDKTNIDWNLFKFE